MDAIPLAAWQAIAVGFMVLAAVIVALWLYNRREARRKRALELAMELQKWGLTMSADILSHYAVGDYSGLVSHAVELARIMRTPNGALGLLDDCFWKVLGYYKTDPAKLLLIQKAIAPADAKATP